MDGGHNNEANSITTYLAGDNRGIMHTGNGNININIPSNQLLSILKQMIPDFNKNIDINTTNPYSSIQGIPLTPQKICSRENTINNQMDILNNHLWLSYYGEVWSGKTVFVSLLIKKCSFKNYWFRLKGLNNSEINEIIKLIIININSGNVITKTDKIIESNSVIVIDDMPSFTRSSILFNCLLSLLDTCKKYNIKLITITDKCIKLIMQSYVNENDYISIKVPEFSDEDIKQMLSLYNATTEYFNDKFISFLNVNTKGNPSLINAVSCYMQNKNWLLNISNAFSIINGDYYWQINNEIQDIIYSTIDDDDSRELLYRISEIGWPVLEYDIVSICTVEPIINLPMEKVNRLLGSWISRDTNLNYSSSPLINKLATSNLLPNTKKGVHEVVANNIISKKILDPFEVIQVIIHYVKAENYKEAGLMYIYILNKMIESEVYDDIWLVSSMWYDVPLPKDMPIDIKIGLRTMQISYCSKANKDISFLLTDYDTIIKDCPDYLQFFIYYVGTIIYKLDKIRANKYINNSLSQLPKTIDHAIKSGIHISDDEDSILNNPEKAFLITCSAINTFDDLKDWIETIKKLNERQIDNIFNDTSTHEIYLILSERLWLNERLKNENERKWNDILACMDYLIRFSNEYKLELLWAWVIRTKVIIQIEEVGDFEQGMQLSFAALLQASDNPEVQYVLNDIIAKEYAYNKQFDKALEFFMKVINYDNNPYEIEMILTYLRYSEAIENKDQKEAIKYSDIALQHAKSLDDKLFYIQVLVEHIISLWNCEKRNLTPLLMEEAVDKLLDIKDDSIAWKKMYITSCHIFGYYIPILQGKNPPKKVRSGEEYFQPYRMMSIKEKPDALGELFNEEKYLILPVLLLLLFDYLRNKELSIKWSKKSFIIAKELKIKNGLLIANNNLSYYLLQGGDYEESYRALLYINFLIIFLNNNIDIDRNNDENFYFEKASYSHKIEAENKTFLFWSILLLVKVCNMSLLSEENTKREIELLLKSIQELDGIFINKDNLKLLSDILMDFMNIASLFERLDDKENVYAVNNNLYQVIYYLVSSMNVSVDQSISNHLKILPYIDNYFLNDNILCVAFIEFFKRFWLLKIEKYPIKFGIPWKIKNRVESVNINEGRGEIKKLFGIVVSVLNVNLSSDIIDWFDND